MGTTTNDWETLRKEGLEHLQALSGQLWTDYNLHDPGVTLLEMLCYAITDLESRLSLDIADVVTENTTDTSTEHFFSPGAILTINPVTINDYRKLLIDLDGVKNAWLETVSGSEPPLYFDQDNNALLYDYASGAQRINLNGLYRVYIEKESDVKDTAALKTAVLNQLHTHRNLGEDFIEVTIMETETISVFSDIQIAETADANEVMAKIYYDLENFISPRIKQYSLKRMLQKGKTIETIFTGPPLEKGFIDDDDLGTGEKTTELHASDLIRMLMANPEVSDVRKLFIANEPNPDVRDKQEWALVVDSTKALALEDFNSSKLRLFKNETLCPLSSTKVLDKVASLKAAAAREIYDDPAMDLTEALDAIPAELSDYDSIAYYLPTNYGVSETGLPSTAADARRGQARQLRAYLLFFEQILINYLKQLDSFKRLFAFRQDRTTLLQSYFSRLLPEAIWKDDFAEIATLIENDPTESLPFCATSFSRRNRILDHLLAQFNEKFADYALFGYRYNVLAVLDSTAKEATYLNAKADFLENYPTLSQKRNLASNYWSAPSGSLPSDGLKKLIAAKLGITVASGSSSVFSDSEEFFIVEHILLRPRESVLLDFVCSERIAADYQPDPYSYQVTFVIPDKAGRFSNSKFKELAYTTIANETPAHFSYTVIEFDTVKMSAFVGEYQKFLVKLAQKQQGTSTQYNLYRKQLMARLGIGEPKLPALHLDAHYVDGDSSTVISGTAVAQWSDLSGNSHHALALSVKNAPQLWRPTTTDLPWIRFTATSGLKVAHGLFKDDFSLAVVFRTLVQSGQATTRFPLIAADDSGSFALGFYGNGDLFATIGDSMITVESESISPHLALLVYDSSASVMTLTIDGALKLSQTLDESVSFIHEAVTFALNAPCDLGEVIVLDSVLTGSRKTKLEEYLAKRWEVPLSAVSSIVQPALHLDANTAYSFAKHAQTNQISAWKDLSLTRNVATQATPALQPVYTLNAIGGLPAVSFAGSGLTLPDAQHPYFKADFTLGLVYQAKTGGVLLDKTVLAAERGTSSFAITIGAKGAFTIQSGNDSLKIAAALGTPHMAMLTGHVIDNKQLELTLWLDGRVSKTKIFNDPKCFSQSPLELMLGRTRSGGTGFSGLIGEVVLFDAVLSVWERQRLEEYWARKWRIDITGVERMAAPILHLDASRQASVKDEIAAIGERVTEVCRWVDRSVAGNDALQSSSLRRPRYNQAGINGLGAIEFTQQADDNTDYYDDSLNVERSIEADFTILVVVQPDAAAYPATDLLPHFNRATQWTEGVAILDADCSGYYNDFGLSFTKSESQLVIMGGIGDRLTYDHTLQTECMEFDAPHMITFTREESSGLAKLYADGRLHAQADLRDDVILNDSRSIKIGAFNSGDGLAFHGWIGEVIIFDQVLSEAKRQQIEANLAAKWQISLVTLPVKTTGLSLHLDAAATATLTQDANQAVSQWADCDSLSEVAAIQTVTPYQPLYLATGSSGHPALRFNNSNLTVALAETDFHDLTVALVYTALSTGNHAPDWTKGVGLIDHYAADTDHNFGVVLTRNSSLAARFGFQQLETTTTLNTPHIGIITREAGAAAKIYLDGLLAAETTKESVPTVALKQLGDWSIGAVRQLAGETVSKGYFHGEISEVLLFNRVLELDERQRLEMYLAAKWEIDLSGVNKIAKPVLHLDASIRATVGKVVSGAKVAQWSDRNGRSNCAVQTVTAKQPEYLDKVGNELGMLHFDRSRKTCLTLEPMVQDDFSIFIVYRPEKVDIASEYMPVEPDSFTGIAGVDATLSQTIWKSFKSNGYIDAAGNVLAKFTPGSEGFYLGLEDAVLKPIRNEFAQQINLLLSAHYADHTLLPEMAFTGIGGVDQELSQLIWQYLYSARYLDSDGKVQESNAKAKQIGDNDQTGAEFTALIETVVISVVLAQNWLAGIGLFDGNCAGERGQLNKRDFGLLVGQTNQLLAGIGVPDEGDYTLSQFAEFGKWHMGVLTRLKDTGLTQLYLDGSPAVEQKIGKGVSLKDVKRITIGAENNGGNYFSGDIGEIIVLDTVPTATQRLTIQRYLAKKWGIAGL